MPNLPRVGVEAAIEGMAAFEADSKKVNRAFSDMDTGATKLGKGGIAGLTSHLTTLGTSLLKIGAVAGGAALVGITALAGGLATFALGGIKQAIDLDQQVANIAATMGATKETAGTLKDELKGLALDLSLNPNLTVDVTQAGQAIEVLAANGALATDEFGKLTQASKDLAVQTVALANATGSDFATAATIATDAANIFGLQANEMGKAVDGAAGIMNASKFDANDYQLALSNAGSVTAEMGVSLEDFNTVIAGTASSFSSGSDAGTSFKTLMQRLANPTKEVAAEMAKYGISIFDADGNMRDMSEIAGQLNQVLFGVSTITTEVGGATKEQAKAAEQASAKMSDLTRDIGENRDKLKLMTDVYQESLKFYDAGEPKMRAQALAIQRLTNDITDQEEKLAGYNSAIAAVDGAQSRTVTSTQQLTEAQRAQLAATLGGADGARILLGLAGLTADEFNTLSESVNRSGQGMEAAALRVDTVKGAMDIFKGVIQALQIQVGDKFLPLIKQMAINFTQFATQNGPMIVAFFGQLATTIETTIASISTSIGKIAGAFQRFGVRGATVSILGQLGLGQDQISNIMSVFDQVTGAIDKVSGAFDRFGARGAAVSILGMLGVAPETIGMVRTTFDTIIEKIGIVQQVFAQFGAVGAGISLLSILGLSSESIGLITVGIQTVIDALTGLSTWWTTTWPAIQAIALTGWEVLKGIFVGFQAALGPILTQLNTQFAQIFSQMGAILASFGIDWQDVWTAVATATQIVAAVIGAVILGIIGVVAGLATGIASGVSAAITMFQNLATNVSGVFVGLTGIVVGFNQTLSALLQGNFSAALEGAKVLLRGFATFFANIWGGMITVATGTLNIITSTISGFVEGIVGFFQGMYNQLIGNSIIPDMINDIVKWFKSLPGKALAALGDLKKSLSEPFEEVASTIRDSLNNLTEDALPLFSEGIDTVIESVKNFISAIKEAISTIADFVVPDILMPGSPPPLAFALMDIASAAQGATKEMDAFAQAGQSIMQRIASGAGLTGGSIKDALLSQLGFSAKMFGSKEELEADERAQAKQALFDAFEMTNQGIIAGTAGADEFMAAFSQGLRGFDATEVREAMGLVWTKVGGFVETIRSQFGPLTLEMKQQALSVASSLNSLAGSFAETLKGQIDTFQKAQEEVGKLGEKNTGLTITLKEQGKELVILQSELAKLTSATELDTDAIAKKEEAISKLTLKMDENREIVQKNEEAMANYRKELEKKAFAGFDAFASGSQQLEGDLAMIELLQDFLKGTGDEFRVIGEELGGMFAGSGQTSDIVWDRVGAQGELNRLLEEQAQIEEEIAQQQQAQKDLASLQSQLDLLKQGQALGINVFKGLQFGLNASAADILAATNRLAQEMISEMNNSFQVHSPSGVMIDIAKQIMAGLPVGFSQMIPAVTGGLGDVMAALSRQVATMTPSLNAQLSASVMGPLSPAMAGALNSGATTNNYNTFQVGGNSINNGMDAASFEARVLQVIRRNL